jgi:2OG-Fe(II) oxygenase superfamily
VNIKRVHALIVNQPIGLVKTATKLVASPGDSREYDAMKLEYERPRAHLVVDDFFDADALSVVFAELASIERALKPGLVREIGHDGQSVFFESERRKNRAVWLHKGSKSLRLFRKALWAPQRLPVYEHAREPLFQIIPHCMAPHLQVSRYMSGDYYDFHEDEGAGVNLTAIVFLAREPKKVRGGDLVLSYEGEQKTIRFRHNRLVIFPSKTLHRVTPVKLASNDPRDARTSLQCWLAYDSEPEKKASKHSKRGKHVRAPEADVPTFLLAEESIIAGAQTLLPSVASRQSPEVFYWGAFYLSRVLSANLRFLVAEQGAICAPLGSLRIRHGRAGLEIYGRLAVGAEHVSVGFLLRGADTSPSEALSLFVETGRGLARVRDERVLYAGTEAPEAVSMLERLLARKASPSR